MPSQSITMTTKEKVVRESIRRIQKRIAKVDELLAENPYEELIQVNREFNECMQSGNFNEAALKKSGELAERYKQLMARAKKISKPGYSIKLIDEKAQLNSELSALASELSIIELRSR